MILKQPVIGLDLDMVNLILRSITIESNVKFFELDKGMSSGSMVSASFDVPDGMDDEQLRVARLEEKERLDILLLTMEVARGGMSVENYKRRKDAVRQNYDKLLKRRE